MIVLDTNHIRVLQSTNPLRVNALAARLTASGQHVAVTVISVEENLQGWLGARNNQLKTPELAVTHYQRLEKILAFYRGWDVLSFDTKARVEFERIKQLPRLRQIGACDLRVAAIALSVNATVLTENAKDFTPISEATGLVVANWI